MAHDIEKAVETWKKQVTDFVQGEPPSYQSKHIASVDDLVFAVFGGLFDGTRGQVLSSIYDYPAQRKSRLAIKEKRFRRQLDGRRGGLEYFKGAEEP